MLLYRVVWSLCCWFAAVPFCHLGVTKSCQKWQLCPASCAIFGNLYAFQVFLSNSGNPQSLSKLAVSTSTYNGQEDLLFNLDNKHLIYYDFLFSYLHSMVESRNPCKKTHMTYWHLKSFVRHGMHLDVFRISTHTRYANVYCVVQNQLLSFVMAQ